MNTAHRSYGVAICETGDGMEKGMMKSFQKGLLIIELLSQRGSMSVTEISKELAIDKSTVSRHLSTAMHMGYVKKTSNRNYVLDLGILHLSARVLKGNDLIVQAVPYIGRLLSEVGGQVYLGVVWRGMVTNLYTTHDRGSIIEDLDLESGSPIHASSTAKAILAYEPEQAVLSLLESVGMQRFTDNTITDPHEYLEELRIVRKKKYSINNGEYLEGTYSAATPVRGYDGNGIAGLAIAGDYSAELLEQSIAPRLVAYAQMISYSLGYNAESIRLLS